MDEFFDNVGNDPSSPCPMCPNKGCNKRIISEESEMMQILCCASCFECYVATEEEIGRYTEAMERWKQLWNRREKNKIKYGPNKHSFDFYDDFRKQQGQQ